MNEQTAALPHKLIGALIGLARATEGNAYLLSQSTALVVLEGLSADADIDGAALETLLDRVTAEKRKLVPGCFACAEPCGRTDDYDMERLQYAAGDIRCLKLKLLSLIRDAAVSASPAAEQGCLDESIYETFYTALFAIGMEDWGTKELLPILEEVDQMNRKCKALPYRK